MNSYLFTNLLQESPADEWDARLWEFDWYFVPSVNPDGYQFTWDVDRLWRKTRSINAGEACIGVDANRNYDYEWAKGGTDECCLSEGNPCAEDYKVRQKYFLK